MKTSQFFSLILVSLAIGSSILIQDIAFTTQLNQATLFGFTIENSNQVIKAKSVNNISTGYILPIKKVDNVLMPHVELQEVYIEAKLDRNNVYPTRLVDGKYIASIVLDEVEIFARN